MSPEDDRAASALHMRVQIVRAGRIPTTISIIRPDTNSKLKVLDIT
jgi:hypothetical protein